MNGNSDPVEVLDLSTILVEESGNLRVLDSKQLHDLGFVRFFFLDGFENGVTRGNHAHRECWQLFLNFGGEVEFVFQTVKRAETRLITSFPSALLVPPMTWVSLRFVSKESRLMVAATHDFDEKDYIRSKDMFFEQ